MKNSPLKPFIWFSVLILVVSLACLSGGSKKEPTQAPVEATKVVEKPTQAPVRPTKTSEPTEVPATATEVVPPTEAATPTVAATATEVPPTGNPLLVSSLDNLQKAVIQIEADGTFEYPTGTSYNEAGRGSGFIIDPSGIAVTNNHVVTGAAILKVWIGGDQSKTYNAKVLGVSECSDLAVIKIDGTDFPYLQWYEGAIKVGLEVYAAGYPLGEPQFALTKGIVSKEKAGGNTSWASVDHVIQHDAAINPGNSGGPLVDKDARVVGINYRGNLANQYFAIGADLAKAKVEQLKSGNIDSLGLNGDAFILQDGSFSGIWVYTVKSGSPADKAGLKGGDILTKIESYVLATDGTMKDYCDILQSHSANDTLGVQVFRYMTDELLEGQVNGRVLAVIQSNVIGGTGSTGTGGYDETTGQYTDYITVQDDTGTIQVSIPAAWADFNGTTWSADWSGYSFEAPAISAAADLSLYNSTYNESGVFFAASDRLGQIGGFIQLLDGTKGWYDTRCTLDGRYDYGKTGDFYDPLYEGKFDLWKKCDGTDAGVLVLAARPKANPTAYLMIVEVRLVKDGDLDALFKILDSFQVIGSF
jgi:serine protease Do